MKHLKLWITFSVSVIVVFFLTFFLTALIGFMLVRPQLQERIDSFPMVPLVGLLFTAVIISTIMTILVSRWILVPIGHLIHALQEVAAGNFKIRLDEQSSYEQIREMNVNFNNMVKKLNSIEMIQSDFIQNVSHEFKTPLASIEGYTTLLHAAPLSEELHDYTGRILKSAQQLSSLSGNILKLSRLENEQEMEKKETFYLDEQLRQVILTLEQWWSEKQLDIDLDLPSVKYYGNVDLLYQVWINLMTNAIKFTPEYGTITVILTHLPDQIVVNIRDTGIGMSEEVQERIFDKFYQGESGHSMEGNGLGLALVKKIVTMCCGRIQVSSHPKKGSEFIVRLPAREYRD
ncbi:MAG: HAMP domain-containing sensor histidine kinase [Lachnospiraceae bacterium]